MVAGQEAVDHAKEAMWHARALSAGTLAPCLDVGARACNTAATVAPGAQASKSRCIVEGHLVDAGAACDLEGPREGQPLPDRHHDLHSQVRDGLQNACGRHHEF